MTKVTILGSESKESKKLKPIEFVRYYNIKMNEFRSNDHENRLNPKDYKNIELISKGYDDQDLDLFFAYNEDRNEWKNTNLYLGHFNDGVVE